MFYSLVLYPSWLFILLIHMVKFQKLALGIGLILLAVGSYSVYTGYTDSKLMTFGVGQTTAWIFGGPINSAIEMTPTSKYDQDIHVTLKELTRYPTTKAYIDYINSDPGQRPLNSMSIDPGEARSLLLFLSQKIGDNLKPVAGFEGECYSFNINVSGNRYGINVFFNNERPVLD